MRFSAFTVLLFLSLNAHSQISFTDSELQNAGLQDPTTLMFGPDDRLYVGQKNGYLKIFTVVRNGANDYEVTAEEEIDLLQDIPNRNDDDGVIQPTVFFRQVTGLYVTGTASNPVIYVSSSDSRQGAGESGTDSNLDTNSGILSKLTWNGGSWEKLDLVRGLPRSEENHATNGMAIDESTNMLYLTVGGFTNAGAPSNNFGYTQEYALAACILSIDLDAIEALPTIENGDNDYVYDLPTLDDPTRPNTGPNGADDNDPFGGNDGLNQAKWIAGEPVQVYATGFRNPYDVIIAESGQMYTIDNGGNQGWGGVPIGEATANVNNNPNDAPDFINNQNGLHYIDTEGYYGGHPNPTRANPNGAFLYTHDGTTGVLRTSTTGPNPLPADWPPIDPSFGSNLIEGDFQQAGAGDASLVTYGQSTNGFCEYTASNFGGAMQGDLLSTGFAGAIYRAVLNGSGDGVTNGVEVFSSGVANIPLDIVSRGDSETNPGTIWIADFADNKIFVLEPGDFGGNTPTCDGLPNNLDEDNDGYTNNDEIDNGTNPCSASSKPADNDNDNISNLNDPDDDNDGINDVADAFQWDPNNGLNTDPNLFYELFNEDPGTGFFGLGFTGLMTNGSTDYLDQFDADEIVAGGTSGLFTVPTTTGDAINNDQDNAFQFGVDVDINTCSFTYRGRVRSPIDALNGVGGSKSMGIYLGTGNQNNYIKVVFDGDITVASEDEGVFTTNSYSDPALSGTVSFIDFYLIVDAAGGTVQPAYSINAGGTIQFAGSPVTMGTTLKNQVQASNQAVALGVISTHLGGGQFFPTWDNLEVSASQILAEGNSVIDPTNSNDINATTDDPASFTFTNDSPVGGNITKVTLDLSTTLMMDLLFDPNGTVGDDFGKNFTVDVEGNTGYTGFNFINARDNGFEAVEIFFNDFDPGESFSFSADVDPTSIQGSFAPGPQGTGLISGLELSGASVTYDFGGCVSISSNLFPVAGSQDAVQTFLSSSSDSNLGIAIQGETGNQITLKDDERDQTVVVSNGPVGASVRLLVLEGALYIENGGFDIDPFEANTVVNVVEYNGVFNGSGVAEIPVTFTKADDDAGINMMIASIDNGSSGQITSSSLIAKIAAPSCDVILINAGGGDYTATDGRIFEGDVHFSGAETGSNGAAINNTDDDALYQNYRSKVYGGASFSYSIPVPDVNTYVVGLYFAELFKNAPDQRKFDVEIEGQLLLDDYDIFATVGQFEPSIETFLVDVTDGTLDIELISISGFDTPTLSAIEVSTACSTTTLPIELIEFEAVALEEQVAIHWKTLRELNNEYFAVERSVDGLEFDEITRVQGAGTTASSQSYTVFDTRPIRGRAYYRLRQVDFDGTFSYSDVLAVSFGSLQTTLWMYPNPSYGESLNLEFEKFQRNASIKVEIMDLMGRSLLSRQIQSSQTGSALLKLDLPASFAPGMYLVKATSQNGKAVINKLEYRGE